MRKFTLRQNGQMMTTFRLRVDLSQREMDDLIARNEKLGGDRDQIEEVLHHCLRSGIERLTMDGSLD